MTMLEVDQFSVRYHSVVALNKISLRVEPGHVTTVIGPNGAGKTSLVNAIMGLHDYSGTLRFPFAPDATRTTEARVKARITLVPESRDLFGQMSVVDNLRLGAYIDRYQPRNEREGRLKEVFRLFPRLRERQSQLAYTLSGGERQMLALGRALLLRPYLLMLDEPSLGLAPLIVAEIFRIIQTLKDDGVSILLIEQNARAALKVADYAYVLENGTVTLEGKASDVANNPRVLDSYLGLGHKG
ncbi:MAG: ABC transporter ATP-binding protein [Xanthobacteraceae bacterium]|nr:MAG: ABC transporter ATP-binding protein [Xanthobacteraceae bacterium]